MEKLHLPSRIYSYIIGVLLVIVLLCVFLSKNEMKIEKVNINDIEYSTAIEKISFYIDGINYNNSDKEGKLQISGWCVLKGKDVKSAAIRVLVTDLASGESYELPTTIVTRTDVTEFFDDGFNYDISGFYANATDIALDQEKDWTVFLLYQNEEELFGVNTGARVEVNG